MASRRRLRRTDLKSCLAGGAKNLALRAISDGLLRGTFGISSLPEMTRLRVSSAEVRGVLKGEALNREYRDEQTVPQRGLLCYGILARMPAKCQEKCCPITRQMPYTENITRPPFQIRS